MEGHTNRTLTSFKTGCREDCLFLPTELHPCPRFLFLVICWVVDECPRSIWLQRFVVVGNKKVIVIDQTIQNPTVYRSPPGDRHLPRGVVKYLPWG